MLHRGCGASPACRPHTSRRFITPASCDTTAKTDLAGSGVGAVTARRPGAEAPARPPHGLSGEPPLRSLGYGRPWPAPASCRAAEHSTRDLPPQGWGAWGTDKKGQVRGAEVRPTGGGERGGEQGGEQGVRRSIPARVRCKTLVRQVQDARRDRARRSLRNHSRSTGKSKTFITQLTAEQDVHHASTWHGLAPAPPPAPPPGQRPATGGLG